MKNKLIIFLTVIVLLPSCTDPFELTPTNIISDAVVFDDEGLANAFLADLYQRSLFLNDAGGTMIDQGLINSAGGECRNFAPWQRAFGRIIGPEFNEQGAGILAYYPYELIRECNEFITRIPESASLSDDFKNERVSEARFLRAWAYFRMVKLYGGVPLITDVIDVDAPLEELLRPRNSEKEIYDFIGSEMDAIAPILQSDPEDGRISKWGALAFKSRAMLYAASVSNFGTQQLDGLLGFPSSEANSYYQQSLNASKDIIDNGPFSLYRKSNDLVENYSSLFLDEIGNTEIIFKEKFDFEANKGHTWDQLGSPFGTGFNWNSNFPVYLQTLELFDFMDGSTGKVDRAIYDGSTPFDPNWYFEQRDPRMRASIFYPGTSFDGGTVYFHRRTWYTDPADNTRKSNNQSGFRVPGSDWPGAAPARHRGGNPTGMLVRKRISEETPDGLNSSSDYIVFRLAEVMLNYVEAAYYLGDPNNDMANILNNEIRDRVGMPALSGAEITEDKIRQERRVELVFEEHAFWDLRRWRIAHLELHQQIRNRVHWEYDFDDDTYTGQIAHGDLNRVRLHPEHNYYYALGLGRLADNSALIENPGYAN
ncbi:MAG: RagB/SusD family nutrient uptake outer membrane protein [Cyclobacteriaceae bacterium]